MFWKSEFIATIYKINTWSLLTLISIHIDTGKHVCWLCNTYPIQYYQLSLSDESYCNNNNSVSNIFHWLRLGMVVWFPLYCLYLLFYWHVHLFHYNCIHICQTVQSSSYKNTKMHTEEATCRPISLMVSWLLGPAQLKVSQYNILRIQADWLCHSIPPVYGSFH